MSFSDAGPICMYVALQNGVSWKVVLRVLHLLLTGA